MSKKKINKIKTKQKQKQKQSQSVIVNIHKSTRTRKPTNNETPRRNVQQLPTPQYIYTSQTDNLVPQMFNKQGQQETLAEQINKTLDEKINTLVSQYTSKSKIPQPKQPTQQEIRKTRTTQYNKPDIRKAISEYGKNKPKQEVPKIFNNEPDVPLSNIQQDQPDKTTPPKYFKLNEPDTLYVTNTPANARVKEGQFEQESGYSKRAPISGYKSESGYKTEGVMTKEQKMKMREERLKSLFPNKPEEKTPSLTENIKEKIPSLIESLKNKQEVAKKEHIQQKEIEQMKKNDIESMRHNNNEKLFNMIEQQKKINRKLSKIENEKKDAPHGTKGTFDNKIKEYKSKLKSITFNIELLKYRIDNLK